MIQRGEIWWADLGEPRGSGPGFRRPVVIIQSDVFNQSRIGTVIVAAITTNMRLVEAPGNVLLSRRVSRLRHESIVNVSQVLTIDRDFLLERVCRLPHVVIREIETGLQLILGLAG